jgi:polyisoprenoid-binding protein YceI
MANWSFDGAHSSVEFSAKHMVFTTVRGRFDDVDVTLDFNEANPSASTVVAEIKATSINTGQDFRDKHLRSADFLDTENFPLVRFESTSVEPKRGGQHSTDYLIHGNLTIRGVTRPVTLEAEFLGTQADINKDPAKRRAAFSAATKISRKDWGLTWNVGLESGGLLVGDAITIAIEVAALAEVELANAA